jgi:hypothetical protein
MPAMAADVSVIGRAVAHVAISQREELQTCSAPQPGHGTIRPRAGPGCAGIDAPRYGGALRHHCDDHSTMIARGAPNADRPQIAAMTQEIVTTTAQQAAERTGSRIRHRQ